MAIPHWYHGTMVRTGTRVLYLKIQKFDGTRVPWYVDVYRYVLEYTCTMVPKWYHGTYTCTNHGTPVPDALPLQTLLQCGRDAEEMALITPS